MAQHSTHKLPFFRHSTNFLGLSHIQAYLDGVICHYPKLSHPSEGCCPLKEVQQNHPQRSSWPASPHCGLWTAAPLKCSTAAGTWLEMMATHEAFAWKFPTPAANPALFWCGQNTRFKVPTGFCFSFIACKSTYSVSHGNDMMCKLAEKYKYLSIIKLLFYCVLNIVNCMAGNTNQERKWQTHDKSTH